MNIKNYNFIYLILTFLFFYSCNDNDNGGSEEQDIIDQFINATNSYDKNLMEELLADDFVFIKVQDTLFDKNQYVKNLDTLKYLEKNHKVLTKNDNDSIIITTEENITYYDKLLEISPKMVFHKSYYLKDGKIHKIIIDSISNVEAYEKNKDEKISPIALWIETTQEFEDANDIRKKLKEFVLEYIKLPNEEKKKYQTYSNLIGTFRTSGEGIYQQLVFKGMSTVVVYAYGLGFPSAYTLDNGYIRIETDKSDLLIKIKDKNTLIGEGFASGTFKRVN